MKRSVNIDLWAGLFTLGICALFWSQLLDRDQFSLHSLYYPDKILPILLVLGVVILVKAFVHPTRKEFFCKEMNGEMIYTAVVSMIWVLVMDYFGFILSSTMAMFLLFWKYMPAELRTPKGFFKTLVIIAGELAFMWLVFYEFLSVSLPIGQIFRIFETAAE